MTEGGAQIHDSEDGVGFTIMYQPEDMLEVFNNAEENNIIEIQNLQDREDELETATSS